MEEWVRRHLQAPSNPHLPPDPPAATLVSRELLFAKDLACWEEGGAGRGLGLSSQRCHVLLGG